MSDKPTSVGSRGPSLCDIDITVQEITNEMENLDVRKSQGLGAEGM